MTESSKSVRLLQLARKNRLLRARDLREMGIGSATISAAVGAGDLERVSRGVYRHVNAPWDEHLNLSEVLARVPKAVVVLVSALNFHQIGTHQANAVWILLRQNAVAPRIDYPPLEIVRSGDGRAFENGIEIHQLNGIDVPITIPARTVADCFKHRSKLGLELCLETLREVLAAGIKPAKIMDYARMNRVQRVMLPYMEALV